MSATSPAAPPYQEPAARPALGRAGFGNLLASEWTKIRSVRSTVWSLILLIVLTIGFTALFTWLSVYNWDKTDPAQRAQVAADPVGTILGAGFYLGQLAICVLGVLVISAEYTTGVIRASLMAVPRRYPMFVAKAVVFAALVFVIGECVAFLSFFIGKPILASHVPVSLGDPGAARAVVGAGLYLTVLALFAMAVGALIRHTAGAITAVIGFVLVLAPLAQLIPGKIGKYVHAYLPSEAGHLVAQQHQQADQVLSAWQGFGVFCLWTVLLLALAIYLLQRRDA